MVKAHVLSGKKKLIWEEQRKTVHWKSPYKQNFEGMQLENYNIQETVFF